MDMYGRYSLSILMPKIADVVKTNKIIIFWQKF